MYAIVEIAGKQYKIEKGKVINVDWLDSKENESLVFDKVLLLANEEEITLGQPYLDSVKIMAENLGEKKGKKVRGIKFKKRKNYTRTLGHRVKYSQIKINDLVVN